MKERLETILILIGVIMVLGLFAWFIYGGISYKRPIDPSLYHRGPQDSRPMEEAPL